MKYDGSLEGRPGRGCARTRTSQDPPGPQAALKTSIKRATHHPHHSLKVKHEIPLKSLSLNLIISHLAKQVAVGHAFLCGETKGFKHAWAEQITVTEPPVEARVAAQALLMQVAQVVCGGVTVGFE